ALSLTGPARDNGAMRSEHLALAGVLATACYQVDSQVPTPRGEWARVDEPEEGAVCVTGEKGYFCSQMVEIDPGARQDVCWAARELSEPSPAAEAFVTVESIAGLRAHHVRVTFATWFVDNTYGANSSDGWGKTDRHVHQFDDLVGSDHLALSLRDAASA